MMPDRNDRIQALLLRLNLRLKPAILCLLVSLLPVEQALTAQVKADVVFFLSGDSNAYQEFKRQILHLQSTDDANKNLLFVDVRQLSEGKIQQLLDNASLVVTVGRKSTNILSTTSLQVPHIATLLTQENYANDFLSLKKRNKTCAIVIDQPFDRIIKSVERIIPEIRRVGLIESDSSTNLHHTSAHSYGVKVIYENLTNDIHQTIESLARQRVDAIIALHNQTVYNSKTARNILISSYHFNIPLIGYSSAFVRAGALLGVYSTPTSLANITYNYINTPGKCINGNIIHPKTYTIEANPQVAKSLGITLDIRSQKVTINDEPVP